MTLRGSLLLSFAMLCWSGMARAEGTPQERFTAAINGINAELGSLEAVKAPPPFSDPANRARYDAVRETMAVFGTDAFPVDGMNSFETVCALINEASVKHMFVGVAALKKPGMSQAQLTAALRLATQKNAQTYQNETVLLTVANLHCMTAHLPFLSRFAEGLKPSEFTSVRRDGLEQMGKGLANTVFGLATHAMTPGALPENSRTAMDAAVRYAPAVVTFTSPTTRKAVVTRMAQLLTVIPAEFRAAFLKVKAILQDQSCSAICARLQATAPPPGTPPVIPR